MSENPSVVSKEQILYRAVTDKQYGKLTMANIPTTEQYFGDYVLEAEAINRLYKTYDEPISKTSLIVYTKKALASRNKLTVQTEQEVEDQVNKIYSLKNDHTYVDDKSIKDAINAWSRQVITISELTKIVSEDDLSKTSTLLKIEEAVKKGMAVSNSIDGFDTLNMFTDDVEEILKEFNSAYQNTISLGWRDLDKYMNGGLSKGEMAMIMAKAGTGKTQTLMNIAKQYIVYGRQDVVYFALEEKQSRMIGRLMSLLGEAKLSDLVNFTEKHINYSKNKQLLEYFQEQHRNHLLGNFTLAKSTPHTETVANLEQYLMDYGSMHGKMPDVVIIDYPSLLRNDYLSKNVGEYSAEGMMFEQIRGMAERTNTIVWVANQANRMADTADMVTAYNLEGSKQKLNTVELCISLNQTKAEKANGYIRFYLDKVRNATELPEDRTIYMKVNSDSIAYEDETSTDKANHEEIVKESANNDHFGKYRSRSDLNNNKLSEKDAVEKVRQAHQNSMNQYK